MNCNHCNRTLQGDFQFCPYCGTQAVRKFQCPSCQRDADPNWVSCPYCGFQMRGAVAQSPFNQPTHGHHYDNSSAKHHRKKGFLGGLFSS